MTSDLSLEELFQLCSQRLENVFCLYLKDIPSLELKSAMENSLRNGQHLHPLLVYATGFIFDAPIENLDLAASACELMHIAALIHDDLPSIENTEKRFGSPTCHMNYGEGMAVLAGDSLNTLAMQILTSHPAPMRADKRLQLTQIMNKACGPFGLLAGQALDFSVKDAEIISEQLMENIYRLKTGALVSASIDLGRLCSDDTDEVNAKALNLFGKNVGLACQIEEDIRYIESPEDHHKYNKITYPKLFGINEAQYKVESLYQAALEAINYLGYKAQLLRDLTGFILVKKK